MHKAAAEKNNPSIFVMRFDAESWNRDWAEAAHKVVFEEKRPAEMNRIDFALLVINAKNEPGAYCTVREFDHESIYWQYGGAFPGTIGTIYTVQMYEALIEWCRQKYKRITTLVNNENISYLKLCMKFGFRIIGVRVFKGEIFVELLNELEGEK